MTDPHADLRAMLEALLKQMPNESYTYYANRTVGSWFLRAPALVRALMEERDALKAEVEKLRAAKPAEDAKAPSVIRSLMEEVAWLADLRPDIDALIAEARRRKEAGK